MTRSVPSITSTFCKVDHVCRSSPLIPFKDIDYEKSKVFMTFLVWFVVEQR